MGGLIKVGSKNKDRKDVQVKMNGRRKTSHALKITKLEMGGGGGQNLVKGEKQDVITRTPGVEAGGENGNGGEGRGGEGVKRRKKREWGMRRRRGWGEGVGRVQESEDFFSRGDQEKTTLSFTQGHTQPKIEIDQTPGPH